MPFVSHRGQRIHYTVEGSGPLVVLQHGLFMDAASWKANGIIDALAGRHRVVCVDSLGHGLSDKPAEARLYDQDQRAGDLAAVIDALGEDRAAVFGYSMGAWMAVGLAKHYPHKISSLIVGGWDLVNGVPKTPQGPLTFDLFMAFARATAPALVAWVTPEIEPAMRACFDTLAQLDGAPEAVLSGDFPVLLWDGAQDPYHAPMQAFAAANGLPFLSSEGGHVPAIETPGAETVAALAAFLDG
ncbi:alpha/beta fold hydrolase [Caulobacter soli]|uniref:alpha/beta fold hydrolase n=1 Tax=Caulobacter soli TaxID=2708539 RepID=UPI0013ED431C|nr:alpha/beta hydrolase [Caulobacter soli]